jgi:hypothetical protein
MSALVVGDLEFQVRRSERRRTLEITVERDGRLLLSAPTGCDQARLERFVQSKRRWVYEKLAAREAQKPAIPARRFVSGEGLPYLGRTFRLLLVPEQEAPVKLAAGRFRMRRADVAQGREHLVRWYTAHARPWLETRVERYAGRIDVEPGSLAVRELGYRWGSCGKGGRLYFHWRSILLPPRIADYVVVHELVHLREPHHSPSFWRAVERALPDFALRKQWLAEHGAEVGAI